MKSSHFNPEQYALEVGERLIGVSANKIDDEFIRRLQSPKYEPQPKNMLDPRRAEERRGHTRKLKRVALVASASAVSVAAVFTGVKIVNQSGEQAAPYSAEAFALSYFSNSDKSQNIATMEYGNTGEIQANYTKADGTVVPVPSEVIGQKLPISDTGKANISVTWLGSDTALKRKDGKVYVDRNEFGLVATNLTSNIPSKKCEKAASAPFQDSLCVTLLSKKVPEKTDIGFTKEQADYVNGLISVSSDGKTYNVDAVRAIYIKFIAAGLGTDTFNSCASSISGMTDSAIAEQLKSMGKVVFVGKYKTPSEMYELQTDVGQILAANALGVTAVKTTCNQPVRQ